MSPYFQIPRNVIISPQAERVYFIASLLSLAFIPVIMLIGAAGPIPDSLVPLAKIAVAACAFGVATIYAGMEYFIFIYDDSSAPKIIFWFLVLLVIPIGGPIYYFRVYRRSKLVKALSVDTVPVTSSLQS